MSISEIQKMKEILASLGFLDAKIVEDSSGYSQQTSKNITEYDDDSTQKFSDDTTKSKFDLKTESQVQSVSSTKNGAIKKLKCSKSQKSTLNGLQTLLEPSKTLKQKVTQLKVKHNISLESAISENANQSNELPERSTRNEKWLNFISNVKVSKSNTPEIPIKKKIEKPEKGFPFISNLNPAKDSFNNLTPIVAIDCEMVMVEGNQHEVARITIVNYNNHVLFDDYIKPKKKITNYLTWVSGITYQKIHNKQTIDYHKDKLLKILKGRKIVGHTLRSDFQVLHELELIFADKDVRDISKCRFLNPDGKVLSLKRMTEQFLALQIQTPNRPHDSVEDARAAMALYRKIEQKWELEIKLQNYQLIKNAILNAKTGGSSGGKKNTNSEVLV